MITHLIFQLLDKFKIGSNGFRKVLAAIIGLMIFGLLFAVVKFMKMEIPNFLRNLAILAGIDLGGFFFLMWKNKGKESGTDNSENNGKDKEVKMGTPSKNVRMAPQGQGMGTGGGGVGQVAPGDDEIEDDDEEYIEDFEDEQFDLPDDEQDEQEIPMENSEGEQK